MDFNETQSYENVAVRPEGIGATPADTQSERLHAIKERVRARQKALKRFSISHRSSTLPAANCRNPS